MASCSRTTRSSRTCPPGRTSPTAMRGRARETARARRALLERFGVADLADAHPRAVGRGAATRRARASARTSPSVLLLDEPLAALDARTRAAPRASWLRDARGRGPALLVTHDFARRGPARDRGRGPRRGPRAPARPRGALAAAPASSFVADFAGASVLPGEARPANGAHGVALDGGGEIPSTDRRRAACRERVPLGRDIGAPGAAARLRPEQLGATVTR